MKLLGILIITLFLSMSGVAAKDTGSDAELASPISLPPSLARLGLNKINVKDYAGLDDVSRQPSWQFWLPSPDILIYGGGSAAAVTLLIFALWRRRRGQTARWGLAAPIRTVIAQPSAAPELPPGFSLLRHIGSGGMGIVYEALDKTLQRTVAIKQMRVEIAGDERSRRRFLKEARTVAALRHPNIVEIYSVVDTDSGLYLVFEHVSGQTLDFIIGESRLSVSEILRLITQIGLALDYAHGQGIIHQDLKPANIMVAQTRAKVMDFGIARRVQDTLSTMSRGEISGTPAYMAPEQEQGQCRKESDLYALGICCYQMLSGAVPFTGATPYAQKIARRYRRLSEISPDFSHALDAVMDKALSPMPEERYASAAAFTADVSAALLNH